MNQDAYIIRWRGQQQGPYTLETLRQMLDGRQIGMLHEVFYQEEWTSIRELLAVVERKHNEELAQREVTERLAREEQARRERDDAAQRETALIAEAKREAVLIAEAKRKNDFVVKPMDMQKHSGAGDKPASDTSSTRVFGGLLLMIGLGVAGYFFTLFDPSVSTGSGMRVNNIGLMQQQQNGVIIGIGLSLVGILMVLLGGMSSNK
jgi:hypothetical protein